MIADEKIQISTDIHDVICDHLAAFHLCQSVYIRCYISLLYNVRIFNALVLDENKRAD